MRIVRRDHALRQCNHAMDIVLEQLSVAMWYANDMDDEAFVEHLQEVKEGLVAAIKPVTDHTDQGLFMGGGR